MSKDQNETQDGKGRELVTVSAPAIGHSAADIFTTFIRPTCVHSSCGPFHSVLEVRLVLMFCRKQLSGKRWQRGSGYLRYPINKFDFAG